MRLHLLPVAFLSLALLSPACSSSDEDPAPGPSGGTGGMAGAASGGTGGAGDAGSAGQETGGQAGSVGVAGAAGDTGAAGAAGDSGTAGAAGDAGGGGAAGDGQGGASNPGCLDHLVIREIRTRGLGGGYDCFIELFNPTGADVTLDAAWTFTTRKATAGTSYQSRWQGGPGFVIHAGGSFLLANPGTASSSGYSQDPTPDAWFDTIKLPDAGAVRLERNGVVVDTICYFDDDISLQAIDASFACEGTPVQNPHTFSASTNTDSSLSRKAAGCQDTGDNAADFETLAPSTPQNASGESAR